VRLTRRDTLILGATATVLLSSGGIGTAYAQDGSVKDVRALSEVALPDRMAGSPDAPVTVIEYISPSCPHCAAFHMNVLPEFRKEFVETGKVKFIMRPYMRNVLDAVVFMLAEEAGTEHYETVIDTYFRTQAQWADPSIPKPRDALLNIAKQIGFTDATFEAALKKQDTFKHLETMQKQASEKFALTGTPTFYVNGHQLTGDQTIEDLKAVIDPMVPAGFTPPATIPTGLTLVEPGKTAAPATS
jgi:protein-disulfide isomerase